MASVGSLTTRPKVPQSQPLPGQIANSAGGFTWVVDDLRRLRRFLCLGSEGGNYYVGEMTLGKDNAKAILRLIAEEKGVEVVREVVEYSVGGRAAKQDPIIFALALCARSDDVETKRAAYEALNKVCRIPTHLFSFVEFCQNLSGGTGWGRAHRRAICQWYNSRGHKDLAMAVTKYKSRGGWSHRDLFRLCHIEPENVGVACVCKYVAKGMDECRDECFNAGQDDIFETLSFLEAVEAGKTADESTMVKFIREHGLVREHVPTTLLGSKVVWATLLENMPMTAMIRNLGKMSAIGLLDKRSSHVKRVCEQLVNSDALHKARLHPYTVLQALCTYSKGHGEKGSLSWTVNEKIVQALNSAFYLAFKLVQPTGKRFLLAIDVSGSMDSFTVLGSSSLTARKASAAMAMLTARTESYYNMVGFSDKMVRLKIDAKMSLEEVCTTIAQTPMGGTDCAQPMLYAKQKKLPVDVFIVYTDCETWTGKIHPSQALTQYRKAMGIDARLIVCAMTANEFTLADPNDAGMLDMAGFDSAAPEIIRTFALGEI